MESKRYFIELAYNGSAYHGWQRQPNAISVQQVLEEALSRLKRKNISLVGAGRTDTGVHARQMFAHFDLAEEIVNPQELVFLLNGFLKDDIAIRSIRRVQPDAHARFDATARDYEYHISTAKDPFNAPLHYYLKNSPDIELMNQAAKILLLHEDFQCFSRSNTDVKTFLCTIKNATWQQEGSSLIFFISANRFLRNMVRAIVGTLLEVGYKKREVKDIEMVIKSKDRGEAGFSAPAQGLYLSRIEYPQNIFID
ncbi:MAG: tRNA pseudouridine(38-40) synthase TruA [Flavobacteriaceae bacterium]|jgi:tRNA pseudouridine38-40 synthase|nr:tRNA pseudouridine(38-40) synthase TruA [Flavobacteriaceae bacterium]MBT6127758.1 tRNA pseudouridine(38-40) synthase TruA [Flavobacteriaceae bacterium]MDG1028222.1 tRNA pseudouridine(38-40) synthase TruA [Flavobacteriaceae bacterium]MDG1941134.1 tRNA pseudouridine(38-40) synthase TruA [Flavobacteriaceae bacterium]